MKFYGISVRHFKNIYCWFFVDCLRCMHNSFACYTWDVTLSAMLPICSFNTKSHLAKCKCIFPFLCHYGAKSLMLKSASFANKAIFGFVVKLLCRSHWWLICRLRWINISWLWFTIKPPFIWSWIGVYWYLVARWADRLWTELCPLYTIHPQYTDDPPHNRADLHTTEHGATHSRATCRQNGRTWTRRFGTKASGFRACMSLRNNRY